MKIAAIIEKSFRMTYKDRSLRKTTITAMKSLLNKKYIGSRRAINPFSILIFSKIGLNYTLI